MSRVVDSDGNVVRVDFRQSVADSITIDVKSTILYCDDQVILARLELSLEGSGKMVVKHITVPID